MTLSDNPSQSVLLIGFFSGLGVFALLFALRYRQSTSTQRRQRLLFLSFILPPAVAVMVSLRIDVQTAVSVSDTTVTISYYRRPARTIPLNKIMIVDEVWQRETTLRLVTESNEQYTIDVAGPRERQLAVAISERAGLKPAGDNRWTR